MIVNELVWDKASALKRCRGEEDRLKHLVKLILSDLSNTWSQLEQDIVDKHLVSVRQAAHPIKGVVGNFSENSMMNECEQACVEENMSLVSGTLPECKRQYLLFIQELTLYTET
jgi:HPt (histidine-containing phosphotransfer) domain-containing protein